METLKPYKTKRRAFVLAMVCSALFLIMGIILLVHSLITGFDTRFFGGDWNSVLYTFQGLGFLYFGLDQLRYEKFFIQWDDNGITYLLRKSKRVEIIHFKSIESVEIKLYDIVLKVNGETKTISLEGFQFQDIKMVKEVFQSVKLSMSTKQSQVN